MRIRRKPWALPELSECPFFMKQPLEYRGKWNCQFKRKQPIHLELGCGKGAFIAKMAAGRPEINFIAVDVISQMLANARRKITKEFKMIDREVDNIILVSQDIARISQMMDRNDSIDRIYINFCNPWPRPKHKKRRLTYPDRLRDYQEFLIDGGEIHFKTDDKDLFYDSLGYFKETGFRIIEQTEDLSEVIGEENIMTEHETAFRKRGCSIKFLIAKNN